MQSEQTQTKSNVEINKMFGENEISDTNKFFKLRNILFNSSIATNIMATVGLSGLTIVNVFSTAIQNYKINPRIQMPFFAFFILGTGLNYSIYNIDKNIEQQQYKLLSKYCSNPNNQYDQSAVSYTTDPINTNLNQNLLPGQIPIPSQIPNQIPSQTQA